MVWSAARKSIAAEIKQETDLAILQNIRRKLALLVPLPFVHKSPIKACLIYRSISDTIDKAQTYWKRLMQNDHHDEINKLKKSADKIHHAWDAAWSNNNIHTEVQLENETVWLS